MSLVDDKTMIILLGNDATVDGDAKLMTQMKSYGATILAIGNNASKDFTDVDYTMDMPYWLRQSAERGYDRLYRPVDGLLHCRKEEPERGYSKTSVPGDCY